MLEFTFLVAVLQHAQLNTYNEQVLNSWKFNTIVPFNTNRKKKSLQLIN